MKDLKNLEIGEYFRILWRRKYYCLATFVLVAAGAFVYAWRMPDVFKSETRIRVDEPIGSDVGSALRMSSEDRINSIREQLASRTFLERLIEQYQMFGYGKDPGFVMENALRAVQRRIRIDKTSNTTFTISFVAAEPQFAQTFTRQLAQEVIRISNSSRKDRVLATDQFIDEQLRQSAELLKAQEEKIAKFKLQHLGELPQQSSANMSALTGLHSQLSTVESAIQQAQERQKLQDRAARISAVAFDKRPAFVQASRLASAAQAIKARVEGGMKLGDVLDSLDATERAAVDWLADQLTAARTN